MNHTSLNIALLGFGTVGQGVFEIIKSKQSEFIKKTGRQIIVKWIFVRDPSKYKVDLGDATFTTSFEDIINDHDTHVVVELMGGIESALDYINRSLKAKKHVVTANKDLISLHKDQLFELAHTHQTHLHFEAAVAGGIPIIRTLKEGLSANTITSIYGILNGTTNYILSKMSHDAQSYEMALTQAKELGFAEADPSKDISGEDAAHKLVILASTAFKKYVSIDAIHFEGIDKVSDIDIQYALQLGYVIKLLAIGRHSNTHDFVLKVHPTMIPDHHPLASIHNEFNALYIYGDSVGEILISGKGAGGAPTGSAVVSDILDIAISETISHNHLNEGLTSPLAISDTFSQFYLRLHVPDHPGSLELISGIFRQHSISIHKILQNESHSGIAELVVITHLVKEALFDDAVRTLIKDIPKIDIQSSIRVGLEEILTH